MQKLVDTATSFYGGGNAPGRKLFKLSKGSYTDRQIVIYAQSATTIVFCFSDPPYASWSNPEVIAADAADYPVSACLDESGDLFVVYSKSAGLQLVCRRLQFAAGAWSIGDEAVIYDSKDNYFPSIVKDSTGKLHLCWTCYDSATSSYSIRCKSSTDSGVTWGAGPGDPGEALTSGSSSCFSSLLYFSHYLYCFFTDDDAQLAYRSKAEGAVLWDTERVLYQGSGLDDSFSVAAAAAGSLIAVAFKADDKLWYLEYDLANWSSAFAIAASAAVAPLVVFNGAIPVVIYGDSLGAGQLAVKYRYKNGSGFSDEANLHQELQPFECVMLYDADGSPAWQNLTTEAADDNPADVVHPVSGKMLQASGDAVYFGSSERFALVNVILATPGDSAAVVGWYYFDGAAWVAFTPVTGAYSFDQPSALVRLWVDTASAPSDWQKHEIDGKLYYWVKAEVLSAYVTAPLGSQLTPLSDLKYINR